MNRKLIAAIIFIIAACIGSHFYVKWDMARFDASLPQLPAVEELQVSEDTAEDVAEDTGGGHWHGDEWHAEPDPAPAAEEPLVEVAPRALPRLAPLEEVNEELRAILAVPLPPDADELLREHYALSEETLWLNENGHTLSRAERHKATIDLLERELDWNKRFSKRSRERRAAMRKAGEDARRARNRRRILLNKKTVIGAFILLFLIGGSLWQRSRERRAAMRKAEEDARRARNNRGDN